MIKYMSECVAVEAVVLRSHFFFFMRNMKPEILRILDSNYIDYNTTIISIKFYYTAVWQKYVWAIQQCTIHYKLCTNKYA